MFGNSLVDVRNDKANDKTTKDNCIHPDKTSYCWHSKSELHNILYCNLVPYKTRLFLLENKTQDQQLKKKYE